jgi:hypothetical protein
MAVDCHTDVTLGAQTAEVSIVSPVTPDIAALADEAWRPLLQAAQTEDRDWPLWQDIINEMSGDRYASFGMIGPTRRVEGIVVLERGRMLQTAPLAEGATMHYLATAPWNRLRKDGTPLFPAYERARPVGSCLLVRALSYSRDMGYGGRLSWESLEGSLEWYRGQFVGLPGRLTERPRSLNEDGYLSLETNSQLGLAYLAQHEHRLRP